MKESVDDSSSSSENGGHVSVVRVNSWLEVRGIGFVDNGPTELLCTATHSRLGTEAEHTKSRPLERVKNAGAIATMKWTKKG